MKLGRATLLKTAIASALALVTPTRLARARAQESDVDVLTQSDALKQAFINVIERIHSLEVRQQGAPLCNELFLNVDTLILTTDAEVGGCFVTVDPGLYVVQGFFDFDTSPDNNDNGQTAQGKLYVDNSSQPGIANRQLIRTQDSAGNSRVERSVVAQAWLVGIWDYHQVVLADNPKFFMRLDDVNPFMDLLSGGAYIVDSSASRGYANIITKPMQFRQPGATVPDIDKQQAGAGLFNGTNTQLSINLPGTNFGSNTSTTMEAWFKSSAAAVTQIILSNEQFATHRDGQTLYLDTNGKLVGEIANGAASQSITSPLAYNDNTYHYAAFTQDGSNIRLYVDGAQVQSAAQTVATPNGGYQLTVGCSAQATNFYNGLLDELAGYNSALLPNRILEHYNVGIGQIKLPTTLYVAEVAVDSPLGWWRLGDTSGTVALDKQGLNNGVYTGVYALNQDGAITVEADGTYNYAMQLEGVYNSGKVAIGDIALLKPTTALTVELWVKPDPAQNTNSNMAGTYPAAANAGWVIEQNGGTNNQYAFKAYVAGALRSSGNFTLNSRLWTHLVCVFDGTANTLTVYANGDIVASASIAAGPITYDTSPIWIGDAFQGGGRTFTGYIDEFALYGTVLSQARIQQHFKSGKSRRARLSLLFAKTGGTGTSFLRASGTKMIVQQLFALARS